MELEHKSAKSDAGFVVVIGRQFGCGGRRIGKALAERLGVKYYDKNLLAEAARDFGLESSVIAKADEKRPSFISSFLGSAYGSTNDFGSWGSMSPDSLYKVQTMVIERICSAGPCVLVGRTADYIARHHPNLASIFIHAPEDCRVKQILDRGDAACEQEARKLARKMDSGRESYYNYYTGRHWGVASNYHLSIDASKLSTEETVDIIVAYLRARERSGGSF